MKLSVLIATYNRPNQLVVCLQSIIKNTYHSYEIIVIDQSLNSDTAQIIKQIKHANPNSKIIYIRQKAIGLSRAQNLGIVRASGDIIVFTDDDCVVSRNWLTSIHNFFLHNNTVSGVFGSVYPYSPNQKTGLICATLFTRKKQIIHTDYQIKHFEQLGNGNNMSFKRNIFHEVGLFTEWLGSGSITWNGANDGEFIYRILRRRFKLAYVPSIRIYHDKWITDSEIAALYSAYHCGEAAFYVYWGIRNHDRFLIKLLIELWRNIARDIISELQWNGMHRNFQLKRVKFFYTKNIGIIRGSLIGLVKILI